MLFGEDLINSKTWSKWEIKIPSKLEFIFKDQTKKVIIEQNNKVFFFF